MLSINLDINKRNVLTFALLVSVVCVMIFDTTFTKLFSFDSNESSSRANLLVFILIVLFYAIGLYLILRYIKETINEDIRSKSNRFELLHKIVSMVSYLLIGITMVIVIQMVINSKYDIYLIYAVIWISYVLSIVLLGILGLRFILWFKSKQNAVVMIYGTATLILSINAVFTLLYVTDSLNNVPLTITSFRYPSADFNSTTNSLFVTGLNITDILSFFSFWLATVLLLHHYSRKLGKIKYWIIVSIPLIYFISQFQSLFFGIFNEIGITDPFLFGTIFALIFNSTSPVGGILFGIAFWTIATNVNRKAVRDYMIISAMGIVLLFSAGHSALTVSSAPYPPFGLASVWFVGFSSYLLFVGIYFTALSVARDAELRRIIRKSVERQSGLLDSIGTSEGEYQIRKNVLSVTKKITIEQGSIW